MPRGVKLSSRASEDLADIHGFIAADRPSSAVQFDAAAWRLFELIASAPRSGRLCDFDAPGLSQTRRLSLPSPFNKYLVLYRSADDGILVLRVLHAALDYERAFDDEEGETE